MSDFDARITELHDKGFTVIPDVVPPPQIDDLREMAARLVREHTKGSRGKVGDTANRSFSGLNLLPYIHEMYDVLASPTVLTFLEGTLGKKFRMSMTSGYLTLPGTTRGKWHADWPFNPNHDYFVPGPRRREPIQLTTFFMLTDFSTKNGGTFVLPGSHLLPAPTYDSAEANGDRTDQVQLQGTAGSWAIINAALWHSVAPNLSTDARVTISTRYSAWWLNIAPQRGSSREFDPNYENGKVTDLTAEQFDRLPEALRAMNRHLVPSAA